MKRSEMPMQGAQQAEATASFSLRHARPSGSGVGATPGAAQAALVALSDDEALVDALSGAVDDRTRLLTAPSADRFIDQLVASGSALALLDADATPEPLAAFVTALKREFPNLLILVTGSAELEPLLQPALSDGRIFRWVREPASLQALRQDLEAARALAARRSVAAATACGATGEPQAPRQPLVAPRPDPAVTAPPLDPDADATATVTIEVPAYTEPAQAQAARPGVSRAPLWLALALAAALAAAGWQLVSASRHGGAAAPAAHAAPAGRTGSARQAGGPGRQAGPL